MVQSQGVTHYCRSHSHTPTFRVLGFPFNFRSLSWPPEMLKPLDLLEQFALLIEVKAAAPNQYSTGPPTRMKVVSWLFTTRDRCAQSLRREPCCGKRFLVFFMLFENSWSTPQELGSVNWKDIRGYFGKDYRCRLVLCVLRE